jgi:gliding motility-associated-like protein
MLVNASYEPGDFFITKVTDLCPNTNYQFAAWLMNVLRYPGIKPNITFKIEAENGTVLAEYSTGDLLETTQPTWSQYGFYFTTPPGNATITLRMTNNAPGGIGNDIGLDDITFRPCGPAITAVIEGAQDTVHICNGDTSGYLFTGAVSSEFNDPVYQWQLSTDIGKTWQDIPGANTLSYLRKPTIEGVYLYRMAVIERSSVNILSCRLASNVVVINVHDGPVTEAGPDRVSIAGMPVLLQGSVTGEFPTYYWSPSTYLNSDSVLTPEASPPSDIYYTLFATSVYGCKSSDVMQVKTVAGIFVPNAFTPNHDGKNDYWRIPYLDPLLGASVNVYNRYGQVVYHAQGETVNWDGTVNGIPQPSGTYVYIIHFKSTYPDMKGTVVIIR